MAYDLILAGFGGQGILSAGQLLAYAAMAEGKKVSWMPAYGPEQRGGTANCSVVITDGAEVGSPIVAEPTAAVVMNGPSLDKFEPLVRPGGVLVINTSLCSRSAQRTDIRVVNVPATRLATELGNARVVTLICLGALIEMTGCVRIDSVVESLKKVLPEHHHKLIPVNQKALALGRDIAMETRA